MPFLAPVYFLNFTGGEPFLSAGLLRRMVTLAETKKRELGKRARYSVTTNGSLLTPGILRFLARHRFTVTLSFDGAAQDEQRQKGSYAVVLSRLRWLLEEKRIRLRVNSVFTPRTVGRLPATVKLLLGLSVPDIRLTFSVLEPWRPSSLRALEKEMKEVKSLAVAHYRKTGRFPLEGFGKERKTGIFSCAAGQDRLAVTPEGRIWGCHLLGDYFHGKESDPEFARYSYGLLSEFQKNPAAIWTRVTAQTAHLSMDQFSTPGEDCFLCPELEHCAVCPVNAALAGSPLGRIPAHVCRLQRVLLRCQSSFQARYRRERLRGAVR